MKKLNVNISGNVNLFVPALCGDPEGVKTLLPVCEKLAQEDPGEEAMALLTFLKDFLEDCEEEACEEDEGDDPSADAYVMVVRPGQPPAVMTYAEAESILEKFGAYEITTTVPTYDLKMTYDERQVIHLGTEAFLVGPAVVFYSSIDDTIFSLRTDEIHLASRIFEERTVTLCGDGTDFPAILL